MTDLSGFRVPLDPLREVMLVMAAALIDAQLDSAAQGPAAAQNLIGWLSRRGVLESASPSPRSLTLRMFGIAVTVSDASPHAALRAWQQAARTRIADQGGRA